MVRNIYFMSGFYTPYSETGLEIIFYISQTSVTSTSHKHSVDCTAQFYWCNYGHCVQKFFCIVIIVMIITVHTTL